MATGHGRYQLKWRTHHSTVVIRESLYCWGGDQKDLPRPLVHDTDDKRKITSTVDIFNLPIFEWERKSTTGNPPAGVMEYACTSIGNKILYFGGSCKPTDCFHNNLFELNTLNNNWREIVSTHDNVPMRKVGCGMISFNVNGEDNLLVLGGAGPTPLGFITQSDSQYVPSPNYPNLSYTNEAHSMCFSSSPGQWNIPVITGSRPPPCAYFTINALPDNKGVIFGGTTINERKSYYCTNDLFLFTCSQNTIDFQKESCGTTVKWPKRRSHHASAIIYAVSSNGEMTSHFILMGGVDDDLQPLKDCWITNLSTSSRLIWYEINLPKSVTKRYRHSMTTYQISKTCVWIIVTAGGRVHNQSDDTRILVSGSAITVILELEYINNEWSVKNVWNSEQLLKNKTEIQKNLIHQIVGDRLQEGALVTDLIGSIKSQETQRAMEKKIFEKESELLKLSLEMKEKSDKIAYLKTRELSLIDKSEKLEKELGFCKDELQSYKKVAVNTKQASLLTDNMETNPFSSVCHCVLGIDHLNAVFRSCKNFSKEWKFIGLQLGITKNTLDNIKENYHDVKERMLEMLASWLKRESMGQPVPTWNILLTTLSEYDRIQAVQIASEFVCKHVK